MGNFYNELRRGYGGGPASTGNSMGRGVDEFSSRSDTMAFFRPHWQHGATNEGEPWNGVRCHNCNLSWTPDFSAWTPVALRDLESGPDADWS